MCGNSSVSVLPAGRAPCTKSGLGELLWSAVYGMKAHSYSLRKSWLW